METMHAISDMTEQVVPGGMQTMLYEPVFDFNQVETDCDVLKVNPHPFPPISAIPGDKQRPLSVPPPRGVCVCVWVGVGGH